MYFFTNFNFFGGNCYFHDSETQPYPLEYTCLHTMILLNDILVPWIMALNMKEGRIAFWKAIISKYSLYLSAGVKIGCYGELNFLKMPVSRG